MKMLEMTGIHTADSALSPRPLNEVVAAALSIQRESSDERVRGEIFTSGETRWSADVIVRLHLADIPRQEAKRRRLLQVLAIPEPLWNPASHPEFDVEGGAAAWVKKMRHEAEGAFEKRTRTRDGE